MSLSSCVCLANRIFCFRTLSLKLPPRMTNFSRFSLTFTTLSSLPRAFFISFFISFLHLLLHLPIISFYLSLLFKFFPNFFSIRTSSLSINSLLRWSSTWIWNRSSWPMTRIAFLASNLFFRENSIILFYFQFFFWFFSFVLRTHHPAIVSYFLGATFSLDSIRRYSLDI